LTEEIWEKLGHKDMLVFEPWPIYDETKLGKKTMTIVVSVNGKRRADFVAPVESEEKDLVATAKSVGEKYLTGEIVKTIVVPGKMVNFVIK
jgi:leucyl-tRNA synthetase